MKKYYSGTPSGSMVKSNNAERWRENLVDTPNSGTLSRFLALHQLIVIRCSTKIPPGDSSC